MLTVTLSVPAAKDFDLELYGPDATWVAGSYNPAGQNERIDYPVPQAGTYFARTYGYPIGSGSFSTNQPYQIAASLGAPVVSGTNSGTLTQSVTWSGAVYLSGDVTVAAGTTLTILPGTLVSCRAGGDDRSSGADASRVEIIVNGGTLNVVGTPGAPVVFNSSAFNKAPGDWYGIRVTGGDVTLSNCVVSYAVDGVRFEDTDTRFKNYALGNVTVQRCSGNGVWTASGQYAAVTLNNFQLWTNATGLSANGPVTMAGGHAVGNSGPGIYGSNPALVLSGTLVSLNGGDGIDAYYSGSLQLSGCTVLRNKGWGLYAYGNGPLAAEIWNNVVQSNGSGGLSLNNYMTIGVVSNTISGNFGNGLTLSLSSGGLSASGITGNAIWGNGGVGVEVQGNQPSVLSLSGNDIYQNTNFELRNDSSISITASNCYWAEPTTTEFNQGRANLSRIYDRLDNSPSGPVTIQSIRLLPLNPPGGVGPSIADQPQPMTVVAGSSAWFFVVAAGSTPFTYQWQKNGSSIGGATNQALVLPSVQVGDAGTYSVVVSNIAGRPTSDGTQLTVVPATNNFATRTITTNGAVFSVMLTISPPPGAGAGFIEETLPAGFTATGINAGGTFSAASGTILWGPLTGNQQLTYTLQPPTGFQGTASVSGMAFFYAPGTPITGDSVVHAMASVQAPRLAPSRIAGFFAVSLTGVVGSTYRIEATENLGSAQWGTVVVLTLTQSSALYIDPDSVGKPQRFYRAVAQ